VLSSMDDYPIHQTAAPIAHVGTSDRNFYDRYYFNLHGSTDELFMVIGMGQYPNLATQDAFACVCSQGKQRVLRASRELGDRMDTTVGPFRVEVLEPLHRVRVIAEASEHPMAFDLTWTGAIPTIGPGSVRFCPAECPSNRRCASCKSMLPVRALSACQPAL